MDNNNEKNIDIDNNNFGDKKSADSENDGGGYAVAEVGDVLTLPSGGGDSAGAWDDNLRAYSGRRAIVVSLGAEATPWMLVSVLNEEDDDDNDDEEEDGEEDDAKEGDGEEGDEEEEDGEEDDGEEDDGEEDEEEEDEEEGAEEEEEDEEEGGEEEGPAAADAACCFRHRRCRRCVTFSSHDSDV